MNTSDKLQSFFHHTGRSLVRLIVLASMVFGSFSISAPVKAATPSRNWQDNIGSPAPRLRISTILADSTPPNLPASFFGEIHLNTNPQSGAVIEARIPTMTAAAATTLVILNGTTLTYTFDVPGDILDTPEIEGGVEGDVVTFSIGGVNLAGALWHSGSHTQLNFTSPSIPPPLPASFFGAIHITPTPPQPGAIIEARISGVSGVIASTTVVLDGSNLVYSIDIPGDVSDTPAIEGATEGAQVIFSIAGVDLASAPWHSGTHTQVDFVTSHEPPPLPATFYGDIHFSPTQPDPGTAIEARIAGLSSAIASTVVVQNGASRYYSFIIPGDIASTPAREGAAEGEIVTFSLGGRNVATSAWHTGSFTRLDFNFCEISLKNGWNLVSFNLHPSTTTIADVLSSINGNYDQVYGWNPNVTRDNWLFFSPFVPVFVNTLATLDETTGFWVHVTSLTPVTLSVTGSIPTSTTFNLSTTAGGWNLVSFPAATVKPLPDSIPANVSQVFGYIAGDPIPWKVYDRNVPIFLNSLSSLTPGMGYWVFATSPTPWVVTYP